MTQMPQNTPETAEPPVANQEYGAHSIKVLKGLDAVRKRPGMYIGDTDDGSGLHHMVYETVDNSVDEALAGHCDLIEVILNAEGSVTVRDNGRGIPTDIHPEEGVSAAEVIMTRLHAGGKFDQNSYKVSGGLHGVGVSVVNALSTWLELRIWKHGKEWLIRFEHGVATAPLEAVGEAGDRTGTEVTFLPSPDTFSIVEFSFQTLEKRLRELAFLNSGVHLQLIDARGDSDKVTDLHYEGGILAFVKWLDRSKTAIHETPIALVREKDGITVEAGLEWTDSYHETMLCFTNNIPQRDGGTHLAGFRAALTRTINTYIQDNNLGKKLKVDLTGDDMREGLSCVLSVKVPDPKFSSQTKDKLVSSEVRPVVDSAVSEALKEWLEENPNEARQIIQKFVDAAVAREAARKARDLTRKKGGVDIASVAGKLADCSSKNPEEREIFIVEGDSAGGSAKQARDRKFQAILPLRGKILNVERARFDRMLASQEIGTMITALGTGIGQEDFSIEKLRYHKIIIMTDADVDGSHIRTLLLTFFFRQMPEIIEGGYLYIAQPPLFKVKRGQSEQYLKDERALENFIIENGTDDSVLTLAGGEQIAAAHLQSVIRESGQQSAQIRRLGTRIGSPLATEQAAIAGFLSPQSLGQTSAVEALAARMNIAVDEGEQGWNGDVLESGALRVSRTLRDVREDIVFDEEILASPEAKALNSAHEKLKARFDNPAQLTLGSDDPITVYGPLGLYETVIKAGRKGFSIQRYKGLGEMNPDQLWETTLDPNVRNLVQVKVTSQAEADDIFSTLMGDIVEPRRDFIQSNALEATNIDA